MSNSHQMLCLAILLVIWLDTTNGVYKKLLRAPSKRPMIPIVNVARGQPTWQSSLYVGNKGHSHLAVDGNKNDQWSAGSCAHTDINDHSPWWAVDLGKPTDVYGINMTGRGDCCGEKMSNFIVGLTNNTPSTFPPITSGYTLCGQYPGVTPNGQTFFVPCSVNSPPARYVVILGHVFYMHFCELEVYEADSKYPSCKDILTTNPNAPSGEYSIRTSTGQLLDKVYCEMGLNGGGYTFLNPFDLARLTDAEIQTMFTDKSNFLLRVKMTNGIQPYGVLKQLTQYRNVPLKLSLNDNADHVPPVNVQYLGSNYLYYSFVPHNTLSQAIVHGLKVNDIDIVIDSCAYGQSNSYFALFPNFREASPSKYLFGEVPGRFYVDVMSALKSVPSARSLPEDYFMFFETHWGGCGTYAQSDGRQGLEGALAASIGFR